MSKERLYIGLMSGTSMDGLDGVLVRFADGQQVTVLASAYTLYPATYRAALSDLLHTGDDELHRVAQLATQHSELAFDTVQQLLRGSDYDKVVAIGNHGQTVRHMPEALIPYSIQIGNGAKLAELSGITTITDFRSRDIAAGGQGAPLVPAFHQQVLAQAGERRAIVNIGGIANITVLDGNNLLLGYDVGPGNALMDDWCQLHQGRAFDQNGDWARSGEIRTSLLRSMSEEAYFAVAPPKSTGRELFNLDWLYQFDGVKSLPPEDVQATLCALTAQSIAQSVANEGATNTKLLVDGMYLCGGGARNDYLVSLIARYAETEVQTTQVLGLDPQLVEATAFAWLARQCVLGLPGNVPSVTGARSSAVLGAIYPG